ncbi:MAG: hypothetical protein QXR48_03845 [Candidatus Woesearchaeota archaeon]
MSGIGLLVGIVIAVLIVWAAIRILKGVVRTVFSLAVVLAVVVFGIWVLSDINDLKNHFYEDEKLFVLDIDGKVAGAFTLARSSEIPSTIKDLAQIRQYYPDLGKIRNKYYKVIVLKWELVADNVVLENFEALSDELKTALVSESPKEFFIDKTAGKLGKTARSVAKTTADVIYPTEDSFRSAMFALLAAKPLSEHETMLKAIKNNTAIIYPETITFKLLRMLPEGVAAKMVVPAE